MENELHAHIAHDTTDCDGRITTSYLMTMTDDDRARKVAAAGVNDFTDIEFTDRVVSTIVNAYSLEGEATLTVTRLGDGDVRLVWSEPTEEGHRFSEATLCTDPCDLGERSTYRDHRAESMGY